jgi:hypothetical protein
MAGHVRAELDRLARQVKQLQRFAPSPGKSPGKGCPCQICRMRDYAMGAYFNRNEVLELIRKAKR